MDNYEILEPYVEEFLDNSIKLSHKLYFGKHKGLSIKEIINTNISYISWARRTFKWFILDKEAESYYEKILDLKPRRINDYYSAFGDMEDHWDRIDDDWDNVW